jgi:HEAT repeat protein
MIQNLAHKQMAIETFSDTLRDNSPEIRAQSAEVLGVIGSHTEVPELINALKDSNAQVRLNATKALAKIGDENAIPALCHLLSEDPDDEVRSSAASALGRIGNDTAQLLVHFEQHQPQNPELHQSIAQILQQQPDLKQKLHQFLSPSSIPLIKALIQHPLGQTMLDAICQEVAD